jgi:thiamine pyrophosphate-dependent acetolactate synthase large subunit-like protein
MGMSATAVSTARGFNKALENAFKEPGPHLIDAIVRRDLPPFFVQ